MLTCLHEFYSSVYLLFNPRKLHSQMPHIFPNHLWWMFPRKRPDLNSLWWRSQYLAYTHGDDDDDGVISVLGGVLQVAVKCRELSGPPNNHSRMDKNPKNHSTMDRAMMSFLMRIAHEMEPANQFWWSQQRMKAMEIPQGIKRRDGHWTSFSAEERWCLQK